MGLLWGNDKKPPKSIRMDDSVVPKEIQDLEAGLLAKVAGQDRAVKQFARVHETFLANMQQPDKPLGVFLFVGPTGSGKTHLVEIFSELMNVKLIKVDCAEYQHSHEISKLIGSPPGYVGNDIPPLISKEAIEEKWKTGPHYTVILFDEIEKAHNSFHQILLGIMDKATLTSGRNVKIDLHNTIIVMTSNLGSKDVKNILDSESAMGFVEKKADVKITDNDIYKVAKKAVKAFFSTEFFNRIDRMIVFQPLSDVVLKQILEMELSNVQDRILKADKFISVEVSDRGKAFLLSEGTSRELGARELRRTIERYLVSKLVRAFAIQAAVSGDMILADKEPESDHMVLDIVKDAMELPKSKEEPKREEPKRPRPVYVDPENPDAKVPYPGKKDPEYCGRCGFRWYPTHRCGDLVDSAFERFRKEMEERRRRKP